MLKLATTNHRSKTVSGTFFGFTLVFFMLISLGLTACGDNTVTSNSSIGGVSSTSSITTASIPKRDCLPALSPPSNQSLVQSCVSNEIPKQDTDVTLYSRLIVNGKVITGAKMEANWDFKFFPYSCKAVGDSVTGVASCTRNIGNATKNYKVSINVDFTHNGTTYKGTAVFTTDGSSSASNPIASTTEVIVASLPISIVPPTATVAATATPILPTATPTTAAATATPVPTLTPLPPTATATPAPPTASPTPKPKSTATPMPANPGLGVTRSTAQRFFESKEYGGFKFKSSPLATGEPRVLGEINSGLSMIELIGPAEELTSVSFTFGFANSIPKSIRDQNIKILGAFLGIFTPDWNEGVGWITGNAEEALAKEKVETTIDNRKISLVAIPVSDGVLYVFSIKSI